MIELKRRSFEHILSTNSNVIILCGTPFCGTCKMLGSYIEKDFENNNSNIKYYKYDMSTDVDNLSEMYNIVSVPTLLIYKNSELKEKISKFIKPNELQDKIKEYYEEK